MDHILKEKIIKKLSFFENKDIENKIYHNLLINRYKTSSSGNKNDSSKCADLSVEKIKSVQDLIDFFLKLKIIPSLSNQTKLILSQLNLEELADKKEINKEYLVKIDPMQILNALKNAEDNQNKLTISEIENKIYNRIDQMLKGFEESLSNNEKFHYVPLYLSEKYAQEKNTNPFSTEKMYCFVSDSEKEEVIIDNKDVRAGLLSEFSDIFEPYRVWLNHLADLILFYRDNIAELKLREKMFLDNLVMINFDEQCKLKGVSLLKEDIKNEMLKFLVSND